MLNFCLLAVFFNVDLPSSRENTSIKSVSKDKFLSELPRINLEFEIRDIDDLHQAQLLIPVTSEDRAVGHKLHSCQLLSGTKETVKFPVEMSALINANISKKIVYGLQVIDKNGYITGETFSLQIRQGSIDLDVNRDGVVNIFDLILVSQHIGKQVQPDADPNPDVNGDGIVTITDIILVSSALSAEAAAPSLQAQLDHYSTENGEPLIRATDVQRWLTQAEQLNLGVLPKHRKGIAVLKQLLEILMEMEAIPVETALLVNYPNPFNPETWIPYQLAKPADVTLTIYDINGRVMRDLDLGHQRAGMYHSRSRAAYWDGRNAQGEPVASGVYFYGLKAGDFSATRKMLIRK